MLVACGPWRCGFLQIRSILVFIQRCCLFLKIRMLLQIYQSCCLFLKIRMNGHRHERMLPRSPLSIQPHTHTGRSCTAQPCVAHAYIPRSGAQRIYMNQALLKVATQKLLEKQVRLLRQVVFRNLFVCVCVYVCVCVWCICVRHTVRGVSNGSESRV